MNTIRVFLQDQLWKQDPEGFKARLDIFLSIAARHHIRPILCCSIPAGTRPTAWATAASDPWVHNSGWVQSPGKRRLMDKAVERSWPLTYEVWWAPSRTISAFSLGISGMSQTIGRRCCGRCCSEGERVMSFCARIHLGAQRASQPAAHERGLGREWRTPTRRV